ncbi:RagB/SusD family nutrient uptake outer membrane protein [Olivibacter sitiensis]|uniref:RagB/SusD family nutrient uptake outer membrane protein n=1 Tax=Olivibacter sitiensis TaxID=376470 RepID=UPI001B7F8E17|nr:RagB/SusD family nutrient uptake outer membrane protein [Olivibacter sitiensis]
MSVLNYKSKYRLFQSGGKYVFCMCVLVVMGMSGCKDYLEIDNPSTISDARVFNSTSYTFSALTGVYNRLMGDDAYGSRLSIIYPFSTEDFRVGGDYNPLDRRGVGGYMASPQNTELNNPFNQLYEGIERANMCIRFIPESEVFRTGSASEQELMNTYLGEALTLRAWFFHELIRNWGDVPAPFEPASYTPDLFLPKEDKDVIYDKVLEDLARASELVPWQSESGNPSSRLTKEAVKAIRARLALARGGYSLRRDGNTMQRREDYLQYYQMAHDECLSIIEHGGHRLNPVFENVFRFLHSGGNLDNTNEVIFRVGAFGGGSRTDSKLGYANGIRINTNSSYGQANGGTVANVTFFYEYEPNDQRRDVTLAFFEIDDQDRKTFQASNNLRDGKFRKYWTNVRDASQSLGVDWPMIRYSDILLLFAEADNELNGGPSAQAIEAYDEVRARAFGVERSDLSPAPSDYTGFFNAINRERMLEFADEGIRKYDLIRWNLLGSMIDETRNKLRQFMNREGQYSNVPQYVYYRPTAFQNASSTDDEVASLDLYGGNINQVLFTPGPTSTPTGYSRVSWSLGVNEDLITGPSRGFAIGFQPNKSELLPIYSEIVSQNYNLTQDYGY